jgi:hypothetical protein
MKGNGKKKLERHGWKVGTAQELLGLTAAAGESVGVGAAERPTRRRL